MRGNRVNSASTPMRVTVPGLPALVPARGYLQLDANRSGGGQQPAQAVGDPVRGQSVLVEGEVVVAGLRPAVFKADPGDPESEAVARDQVADQFAETAD